MKSSRPFRWWVMSITPFKTDFSIDEEALRAHVRRMVATHTGMVMAAPGVGEGWTLSPKETGQVVKIALDEAHGQIPIWMTTRDSCTAAIAYEPIKEAIAAGVECVRIYPVQYGLGMSLSEREQESYWTELLEEIHVPVSVATIHATYRTPLALVERLVKRYPQINSVYMGSDPKEVHEWRRALPERIEIFSSILNAPFGASASIGAANNVIPRTSQAICDAWNSGDTRTYADLLMKWERFLDTWNLYKGGHNTARAPKANMKIVGLGNGLPRPPLLIPADEEQRDVAAALDRIGLAEWDELRQATRVPAGAAS